VGFTACGIKKIAGMWGTIINLLIVEHPALILQKDAQGYDFTRYVSSKTGIDMRDILDIASNAGRLRMERETAKALAH
jgi:hypothetical protein